MVGWWSSEKKSSHLCFRAMMNIDVKAFMASVLKLKAATEGGGGGEGLAPLGAAHFPCR